MDDYYTYDSFDPYATATLTPEQTAAVMGFMCVYWVVVIAITVLMLIGLWKIFVKAGKPGWAAIIPIYNIIVLLEIIGRPLWWIVLFLVPFVNIVANILVSIDLAKAFGRSSGFGIGLAFLAPIFYPILGFGNSQYKGMTSNVSTTTDSVRVEDTPTPA